MRGKPIAAVLWWLYLRSIPACAGETDRQALDRSATQVHPRVCGGNIDLRQVVAANPGPSPRVRGKPITDISAVHEAGSIPACAGETTEKRGALNQEQVHPRVCGGNPSVARAIFSRSGPSPRVRGKPGKLLSYIQHQRSIPACAGETVLTKAVGADEKVHPRVCGGNTYRIIKHSRTSGPSPRVRGKPPLSRPTHPGHRSIPACAGETAHS